MSRARCERPGSLAPQALGAEMTMLAELVSRDSMINECAVWFGVHPRFFRNLEAPMLEQAWCVVMTWGQ